MKQYQVTMPDGSVWGVPVSVIARNHAEYYAQYETEGDAEKCFREHSLPLLSGFPFEVWEWAAGNMNWDDVKSAAHLVRGVYNPDADYQDGWVNGAHEVVDVAESELAPAPDRTSPSGWVKAAAALPILEHVAPCRRGKVEVAERSPAGDWNFAQLYAPNVQPHETYETFWRYLPAAPDLVA